MLCAEVIHPQVWVASDFALLVWLGLRVRVDRGGASTGECEGLWFCGGTEGKKVPPGHAAAGVFANAGSGVLKFLHS